MKNDKGNFGIDIINPASFYSKETEKTKLNWFCYELSISIYNEIKENLEEQLKKYKLMMKVLLIFQFMSQKG
jgi:hypothetical protein